MEEPSNFLGGWLIFVVFVELRCAADDQYNVGSGWECSRELTGDDYGISAAVTWVQNKEKGFVMQMFLIDNSRHHIQLWHIVRSYWTLSLRLGLTQLCHRDKMWNAILSILSGSGNLAKWLSVPYHKINFVFSSYFYSCLSYWSIQLQDI